MIVRVVAEDEWELWARLRNAVEVDAPTTADDVRAAVRRQPETRHWVAEDGGEPVGCLFVARSAVPGRAFVLPRVPAGFRGRGAGAALLAAGLAYARELGCDRARSHVDGADADAIRFAGRHGFAEVDRQVELVRPLAPDEPPPVAPPAIRLTEGVPDDEEALVRLVAAGVADMPVVGGLDEGLAAEIVDELRGAVHVVVAHGAEGPVGVAGLLRYGARQDALEHAFTTVLPTARGRGIAQALKRACVHWAAGAGYGELVTWTQQGNEAMQAVNERAGFREGRVSLTVEGPVP